MKNNIGNSHGMTPMPQSPKIRFSGEYIGIVESTDDPEGLMRVQVRVKEVFTDDVPAADLPWATYKLPVGFRPNDGMFTPADIGDHVWVDFPFDYDTRRPRITGSVHYCPDRTPNFPDDSWAGPGAVVPGRTSEQPEAGEQPEYHTACIYKQHGISAEIRQDGTFRITQVSTGANAEIAPDGSAVVHATGNLYLSTEQNEVNEVKNDRLMDIGNNDDVAIQGDANLTVMGDMTENIMGSVVSEANGDQQISGQRAVYIRSAGKVIIEAPSVEIK